MAQPISIPFIKNGIEYEYTPDFFVQFYTGGDYECYETKPMIVEVKPLSEWKENWRDWSDKWKAAIQYCREQDFRFKIYDENRIRNKALKSILKESLKKYNIGIMEIKDIPILKKINSYSFM